ncbi:MAG TPA: protealysin inhibitor emfourin, partial [Streptosporangiales bacterium]
MRIAVTRSGGFAGLVRRAEIDSADHPDVARLLDAVRLDELPEPAPRPDRFVYEIEIGDRAAQVGEADL